MGTLLRKGDLLRAVKHKSLAEENELLELQLMTSIDVRDLSQRRFITRRTKLRRMNNVRAAMHGACERENNT